MILEKFKKFYFEKFIFDEKNLKARFFYSFDKKEFFEEVIVFAYDKNNIKKLLNKKYINNFLFNIHLALGISYYKLFPVDDLIIESGFLDDKQILFWKKFYINGLGEFFVKNNLNIRKFNFINICSKSNDILVGELNENNNYIDSDKVLLMWGGGKDSIVSYNIIKNIDFDIFVVGGLDKIKENTIKITGKNPIVLKRILSNNLFKLNNIGYYNGHVPITGIIAFISLFFCYLYNFKYTILSNEKSASQENMIYKGIKINHQYSKSYEFEKDFSNYVSNYISKKIKYFSLLRGMYEYKIAQMFSQNNDFFESFSSCNNNFKIQNKKLNNSNWCCKCDKCVFVFLILSNFLDINILKEIFGKNLFNEKSLYNIFLSLIGYGKNKPFECVGTYEESFLSVFNGINKYNSKYYYNLMKLDDLLKNDFKKFDFIEIENKLLKIYDENLIPYDFKKLIKSINENENENKI